MGNIGEIGAMLASFLNLYRHRELLWMWTQREIRARYKQSLFGFAWAVFQPLALTLVFVIVFSFIIRFPTGDIPYAIFVYTAMLPWTFFARGVGASVTSVVVNLNLVTKVNVPRAIFPIATVLTYFVDYLCGAAVFVLMMLYYQTPVTPAIALLPALLTIQIILMIGLALAGSSLNVLYRDVAQMTPLLLQILMYAVPIIYPFSMVPTWLRPWYLLNPMAGLIISYRSVVLEGVAPPMDILTITVAVSLLIFLGGLWIFKRLERRFADLI